MELYTNGQMKQKTQVTLFYKKYEYLIKGYVEKIEIADKSIELADIEQELRLKLFTSIISYGKKWGHYKKTEKLKPIPIEFYIKTVLNNRMIDLYKTVRQKDAPKEQKCNHCGSAKVKKCGIERYTEHGKQKRFVYKCSNCEEKFIPEANKQVTLSFEQKEIDLGYQPGSMTHIDFTNKVIIVDGFDFLVGLSKIEKGIMCLFLKGYNQDKIARIFKNHYEDGFSGAYHFLENKVIELRNNPLLLEVAHNSFNQKPIYSCNWGESED